MSKNFSGIGSKSLSSGNNDWLRQGPAKSENLPFFGLFTKMNNNQGQVQNSTKSLHGQVSDHDPGSNTSNLSATCDQYARKYESSSDSMMHSLHNPEQSFDHAIPTSHGSYVEVGTGIRIRNGQPRNRASPETLLTQGTTARRIHVQMDYMQVCRYANSFSNENLEESVISEKCNALVVSTERMLKKKAKPDVVWEIINRVLTQVVQERGQCFRGG